MINVSSQTSDGKNVGKRPMVVTWK